MKGKKFIALAVCIMMSAALLASCSQPAAPAPAGTTAAPAKQITLKYGHGNAIEHLCSVYSQEWADLVKEKSNGRITIEIYPAGQLGSLVEMLEAVSLGTLDITLGDPSLMTEYLPEMGLIALPFIMKDYRHAEKVVDGEVGQELYSRLADASDLRILGLFWNGFRNFCTKVPITKVSDCKDILMRSPEAKIYMDTFTTLGMKPTPIPWGEVYTAMQTKVVDAMETGPEAMYTQDFYKIGKYVCKSNHICSLVGPTINEKVWKSLSADDQKLLKDCLAVALKNEREKSEANDAVWYQKLEAGGAVLTEFENRQELVDLFTPYWTDYAKSSKSEDLLAKIIAAL